MKLLAIESADGSASIAYGDGEQVQLRRNEQMRDSLSWLMQQAEALREAHFGHWDALDALVCCVGPGGFTGVRVAVGYVQGLALATGLPCIAINSLDAMAASLDQQRLPAEQPLWLALDARMDELYLASYQREHSSLQRRGELALMGVEQARATIQDHAILAGPGFEAWRDRFAQTLWPDLRLDAAALLRAARAHGLDTAIEPAQLQPIYLRNKVAQTLRERGLA